MAIQDFQHQAVRDDDSEDALGSWEVLVHDCRTPGKGEIEAKKATVNSIWSCQTCGDRWKLLNHKKNDGGFSVTTQVILVWRRITPKDED